MWGNSHLREVWASNVVRFWDDNIVWGNITRDAMTTSCGATGDNIVWGNCARRTVSTTSSGATDAKHRVGQLDNIVWGNSAPTSSGERR